MNERFLPWVRTGFAGLVVVALVTQVANPVDAGVTVTFIVFAVPLRGLQEDTVLHRVMPVAVMADWLIAPPHGPLPFRRVLVPWRAPVMKSRSMAATAAGSVMWRAR